MNNGSINGNKAMALSESIYNLRGLYDRLNSLHGRITMEPTCEPESKEIDTSSGSESLMVSLSSGPETINKVVEKCTRKIIEIDGLLF